MKNILKKIITIARDEWTKQLLPDHIVKLEKNIYIKIFKVIGGISMGLVVSHIAINFETIVFYTLCCFSFLYISYRLMIVYYNLKSLFCSIIKGEWIVRNSPLDKLATLAGKLIFCIKGSCDTAAPIGVSLGTMAGHDTMLEHKGKNVIFLPFLADNLLPDSAFPGAFP